MFSLLHQVAGKVREALLCNVLAVTIWFLSWSKNHFFDNFVAIRIHFREKLLAVGPVDASDAQEVSVEGLVKHIHVIPLGEGVHEAGAEGARRRPRVDHRRLHPFRRRRHIRSESELTLGKGNLFLLDSLGFL